MGSKHQWFPRRGGALPGVGTRRPASRTVCRRARPAAGRQSRGQDDHGPCRSPDSHVAWGCGERLGTGALHRQCRQHPSGAPRAGRDTRRRVRWLCIGHHREHQRHRQLHGHGNNDDGAGEGGRDLFIRVLAKSTGFDIQGTAGTQRIDSSVNNNVADSAALCRPPRLGAASPTGVGVVGDGAGGRPRSRGDPGGRGLPADRVTGSRRTGHQAGGSIRPGRSGRGS